jgi:hypothetical protein
MKAKTLALVLLAVLSFASPLIEMAATGHVETLSAYGLVETAMSLVVLFWWYHLDKAEHDYAAGRLMNAGVLVMAIIALPVYFVRTRGWRRGATTIALAAAFLLLTFLLGEAGEWLGGRFVA